MNKQELNIKYNLLKEISKDYAKKAKDLKKKFGYKLEGYGYNDERNLFDFYKKEKIRFEKWAKLVKHQIEEIC